MERIYISRSSSPENQVRPSKRQRSVTPVLLSHSISGGVSLHGLNKNLLCLGDNNEKLRHALAIGEMEVKIERLKQANGVLQINLETARAEIDALKEKLSVASAIIAGKEAKIQALMMEHEHQQCHSVYTSEEPSLLVTAVESQTIEDPGEIKSEELIIPEDPDWEENSKSQAELEAYHPLTPSQQTTTSEEPVIQKKSDKCEVAQADVIEVNASTSDPGRNENGPSSDLEDTRHSSGNADENHDSSQTKKPGKNLVLMNVGSQYCCLVSEEFFTVNWNLYGYSRNKNNAQFEKRWRCKKCCSSKPSFVGKIPLQDHVWSHHLDGQFTCPHCATDFQSTQKFSNHASTYHPDLYGKKRSDVKPFKEEAKRKLQMELKIRPEWNPPGRGRKRVKTTAIVHNLSNGVFQLCDGES